MVSFVIVTFGRPDLIAKFFGGFPAAAYPHEFVVIDNKPDETTHRVLTSLAAQRPMRVEFNDTNVGFGVACNQGAALARCRVLVFTQCDVVLQEDVTPKVIAIEDKFLYGPNLINTNGGWNHFGNTVIPYLEGYFLSCTRTTWDLVGGFDPAYAPADMEDIDLCYTASKKGVQLRVLPIRAQHNWGGHWGADANRRAITERNHAYFAHKWGFV